MKYFQYQKRILGNNQFNYVFVISAINIINHGKAP